MYLLIAIFTYDKSENGMETNKGNGQQKINVSKDFGSY